MDVEGAGCRVKYLIRDRDGKYPGLFDAILADAGITVVLCGVRMPRMNAMMERWVRTCRRELLDRTLIFNQRHLLHALREYEAFLQHPPPAPGHRQRPPVGPAARTDRRPGPTHRPEHPTDVTASVASSTDMSMSPDLPGWHFRQVHRCAQEILDERRALPPFESDNGLLRRVMAARRL
jgi:hypothetical protein